MTRFGGRSSRQIRRRREMQTTKVLLRHVHGAQSARTVRNDSGATAWFTPQILLQDNGDGIAARRGLPFDSPSGAAYRRAYRRTVHERSLSYDQSLRCTMSCLIVLQSADGSEASWKASWTVLPVTNTDQSFQSANVLFLRLSAPANFTLPEHSSRCYIEDPDRGSTDQRHDSSDRTVLHSMLNYLVSLHNNIGYI